MFRLMLAIGILCASATVSWAQSGSSVNRIPSTCFAVAQNLHDDNLPVHFASLSMPVSNDAKYEVAISYQGHSTYLIESLGGVKIATDYAGWLTDPVLPTAVTMETVLVTPSTLRTDQDQIPKMMS